MHQNSFRFALTVMHLHTLTPAYLQWVRTTTWTRIPLQLNEGKNAELTAANSDRYSEEQLGWYLKAWCSLCRYCLCMYTVELKGLIINQ